MTTRRRASAGAALLLTGLALSACTAPSGTEAEATPTATATATATPTALPIGEVTIPEGATAAVRWTDEIGPVAPQTVALSGGTVIVTVAVACDTEDATVTIAVDGLITSGSTCYYDPAVTRGPGGGNSGTMHVEVDRDALITVTTAPADAHWSGAVSTGPREISGG
ncbi:hypothetical protein SAMN06295885_3059 [Rathayibacter oskolensis]|uniref:Ig-like domain-containing protein n=1 Tax=Rathayibacter oskolensis TaxID=1891671 RepID=A0A1X7PDW1_9MICO|nr:hypothetical protein [Rathayibacter oskolensis]SMH48548.1 hypothetical protein SAMN06295885_3059 [Rathayibacter oskolensis]